jgi:hypothetical protein
MKINFINSLKGFFCSTNSREHIEPLEKLPVTLNAFFCFFSSGKRPELVHSGHKQSNLPFQEIRALIDACAIESNYSDSINIVSDYLMASHQITDNKQLLIDFRSAGWDALLTSLLSIYNVQINELLGRFKEGRDTQIDLYFMIRPGSSNIKDFANTCFSLNICRVNDPKTQIPLKQVLDSFVEGVSA